MKTNYILLSLLFPLLAACSSTSDEVNPNPQDGEKIELKFKTSVLTETKGYNTELNSTQLEKGMVMSISARNITGYEITDSAINNVIQISTQYVADGFGNLAPNGGSSPLSFVNGAKLFISSFPQSAALGVRFDQSSDEDFKASDYMIGLPVTGNPVTVSNDPIALTYNHGLCKVVVNLKVNQFIGVYPMLESCKLLNCYTQTYDAAGADIRKNSQGIFIKGIGEKSDITIGKDTTFNTIQGNNAGEYILKMAGIIPPMSVSNGSNFIQVTCSSELGATSYNYRLSEDINFESGKVYTFNLSPSFVDITTSSVTNWTSGGKWDGDITSD